jgi:hypothetical protein
MIKRFRDLLVEMQPLSLKVEGKRVEKEIRDWQKDFLQTNDMLLIWIRF